MADCAFEIEYIDRSTGKVVIVQVPEMRMAQTLARELAMAHGSRAIIRRKTGDETWSLLIVEADETGGVDVLRANLSRREASIVARTLLSKRSDIVVVPWPNSRALPRRVIGEAS